MKEHTHKFNIDTGMCEECYMHRDDLFIQSSGEYPEDSNINQGDLNGS